MNRSVLVAFAVLVVIAATTAWMLRNGSAKDELELGGYFEAEQIQVGSKWAGRVKSIGVLGTGETGSELLVEEGSVVEAGQVLVNFETEDVEAQLAEARAESDKAKARLAELREGTREEEKAQAVARRDKLGEKLKMFQSGYREQEKNQADAMYKRSQADAGNARANYERLVGLLERKAAAIDTVDAARKTMEMANRLMEADREKFEMIKEGFREEEKEMVKNEMKEAEAAWEQARNGPRPQEVEQADASVRAAEARVRRLEVLFEEGTVLAPVSCIVEAFDLQPGDMVAPGAPLATLVRKDQMWVRAFIPETDLGFAHENQTVRVKVDTFPDQPFNGKVLRINRIAEFTPRNVQTFKERQDMLFGMKVRVTEEEQDSEEAKEKVKLLRPGMAATVYVPKKS